MPEPRWCRWTHRGSRRKRQDPRDRLKRACNCGQRRQQGSQKIDIGGRGEDQQRKPEVVGVEPGDVLAKQHARRHTGQYPKKADARDELEVMPGDLCISITESLQQTNLAAFEQYDAVEREEGMRELVAPAMRGLAAIALEQDIDAREHTGLVGAACRADKRGGEGALQIVDRRKGTFVHPDDAEAAIVRHDVAWPGGINEFGGVDGADNPERVLPPVEDGAKPVAGPEPVRVGEGLVDDNLVC